MKFSFASIMALLVVSAVAVAVPEPAADAELVERDAAPVADDSYDYGYKPKPVEKKTVTEYVTKWKPVTKYSTKYTTKYKPTKVYVTKAVTETKYKPKTVKEYVTKYKPKTVTEYVTKYKPKTVTEYVTKYKPGRKYTVTNTVTKWKPGNKYTVTNYKTKTVTVTDKGGYKGY